MNTNNISEVGEPRRSKGQARRAAILLAATKLATTKGLDGLSIVDLAAEVGLIKGGMYAHFKSKEDMERITPKVALFVRLEAKPSKESEVARFLEAGLAMAKQEPTTTLWFALRLGPTTFSVFDAFADENGRQTHLNGPIAKVLMAKAPELLTGAPAIEALDVLGSK